jgi:hypothetical protein
VQNPGLHKNALLEPIFLYNATRDLKIIHVQNLLYYLLEHMSLFGVILPPYLGGGQSLLLNM